MKDRFDIDQVIRILGLNIRADQADGGADFDVACNIARKKLWKVKEYEDLEENRKLIKLPCSVGDTVYVFLPNDNHFTKARVNKIEVKPTIYGKICCFIEPVSQRGHLYRYFESDFWKTVFPTKEAALQKMKETEDAENEDVQRL